VPSVFPGLEVEIGTPDVIPVRFRASQGIVTSSQRVAGVVVNPPAPLLPGEVFHSEKQDTVFVKTVKSTYKLFNVTPTLKGQKFDEQWGVLIPFIETLTTSGALLGNQQTDVQPLSNTLDLNTTIDLSNLPPAQVFYGRKSVRLPIELLSVAIVIAFDDSHRTGLIRAVPTYRHPPEFPLAARFTRTFFKGPPPAPGLPLMVQLFQPAPFNFATSYRRFQTEVSSVVSTTKGSDSQTDYADTVRVFVESQGDSANAHHTTREISDNEEAGTQVTVDTDSTTQANNTSNRGGVDQSIANSYRTRSSQAAEDREATANRNQNELFEVSFPPTIHPEIVIPSFFTIPATKPAALPWGSWVVEMLEDRHVRDGMWMREVTEVYLPNL
jgi:hypothetical protein